MSLDSVLRFLTWPLECKLRRPLVGKSSTGRKPTKKTFRRVADVQPGRACRVGGGTGQLALGRSCARALAKKLAALRAANYGLCVNTGTVAIRAALRGRHPAGGWGNRAGVYLDVSSCVAVKARIFRSELQASA